MYRWLVVHESLAFLSQEKWETKEASRTRRVSLMIRCWCLPMNQCMIGRRPKRDRRVENHFGMTGGEVPGANAIAARLAREWPGHLQRKTQEVKTEPSVFRGDLRRRPSENLLKSGNESGNDASARLL